MAFRSLKALVVVCLAVVACAPGALADGDPASDVLLGENVFYPYTPPVSGTIQKSLDVETAAAKRSGFPLKVALIASPVDLGVIPDLFGKPQKYADFLDQEISFRTKQPLLVVMASGYGVEGLSAKAANAVGSLSRPAGSRSDDLATAAITAVAKLAAASGHSVKGVTPGATTASSPGSTTTVIIAILAAAALATAGALIMLRRRQAPG